MRGSTVDRLELKNPSKTGAPIRVAGVILAAGLGSRMGQNKALLPLEGQPVIAHVMNNAAKAGPPALDPLILVLGFEAERICSALDPGPVSMIINPDYPTGMASSIRAGLEELDREETRNAGDGRPCTGALFFLGDQPRIPSSVITRLIGESAVHPGRILVPCFQGKPGNPVLFDRKFFAELKKLSGDIGGRALFDRHREDILHIPVTSPAILQDLDTLADYEALVRAQKGGT